MFRRLLVAFDGSCHARRALTEAVELAQANNGTLTVMTVAPEPTFWAFSGYDTPVNVDRLADELKRDIRPCSTAPWTGCPPTFRSPRSCSEDP